ncbi:MAG: hypothetical protein FJZ56_00790 [Chlamydiae bacterium]|nr:hypothetical protein [Chlamydiota bacterium]
MTTLNSQINPIIQPSLEELVAFFDQPHDYENQGLLILEDGRCLEVERSNATNLETIEEIVHTILQNPLLSLDHRIAIIEGANLLLDRNWTIAEPSFPIRHKLFENTAILPLSIYEKTTLLKSFKDCDNTDVQQLIFDHPSVKPENIELLVHSYRNPQSITGLSLQQFLTLLSTSDFIGLEESVLYDFATIFFEHRSKKLSKKELKDWQEQESFFNMPIWLNNSLIHHYKNKKLIEFLRLYKNCTISKELLQDCCLHPKRLKDISFSDFLQFASLFALDPMLDHFTKAIVAMIKTHMQPSEEDIKAFTIHKSLPAKLHNSLAAFVLYRLYREGLLFPDNFAPMFIFSNEEEKKALEELLPLFQNQAVTFSQMIKVHQIFDPNISNPLMDEALKKYQRLHPWSYQTYREYVENLHLLVNSEEIEFLFYKETVNQIGKGRSIELLSASKRSNTKTFQLLLRRYLRLITAETAQEDFYILMTLPNFIRETVSYLDCSGLTFLESDGLEFIADIFPNVSEIKLTYTRVKNLPEVWANSMMSMCIGSTKIDKIPENYINIKSISSIHRLRDFSFLKHYTVAEAKKITNDIQVISFADHHFNLSKPISLVLVKDGYIFIENPNFKQTKHQIEQIAHEKIQSGNYSLDFLIKINALFCKEWDVEPMIEVYLPKSNTYTSLPLYFFWICTPQENERADPFVFADITEEMLNTIITSLETASQDRSIEELIDIISACQVLKINNENLYQIIEQTLNWEELNLEKIHNNKDAICSLSKAAQTILICTLIKNAANPVSKQRIANVLDKENFSMIFTMANLSHLFEEDEMITELFIEIYNSYEWAESHIISFFETMDSSWIAYPVCDYLIKTNFSLDKLSLISKNARSKVTHLPLLDIDAIDPHKWVMLNSIFPNLQVELPKKRRRITHLSQSEG